MRLPVAKASTLAGLSLAGGLASHGGGGLIGVALGQASGGRECWRQRPLLRELHYRGRWRVHRHLSSASPSWPVCRVKIGDRFPPAHPPRLCTLCASMPLALWVFPPGSGLICKRWELLLDKLPLKKEQENRCWVSIHPYAHRRHRGFVQDVLLSEVGTLPLSCALKVFQPLVVFLVLQNSVASHIVFASKGSI